MTMLKYCQPYWRSYTAGLALSAVFVLVSLITPLIIRRVVNELELGTLTNTLLLACFAGLLGVSTISGIARYFQRRLVICASRKGEYDLRNDYFTHILDLSQSFFDKEKTGDVMARSVNDLNFVRMFMGPGIMSTMDMMRIPMTLLVMAYLSVKLTLFVLVPLPFVSIVYYFLISFMHRQSKITQEQFSEVTSRAQENLAGARVVKAYDVASREMDEFRKESKLYMKENMKLAAVVSFVRPLIGFLAGLTVLIALWKGGQMVIDRAPMSRFIFEQGALTLTQSNFGLGDLTGFMTCLLSIMWPLVQFAWMMTLYQRGSAGMRRISEILEVTPEVRDTQRTIKDFGEIEGRIRFDNVSFSYDDSPVLKNLSFDIPQGATAAIVGPTGSGKTSIISLLAREYNLSSGRILIDETEISQIPLHAIRGAIGFVPQETFLFADSIRKNVSLGCISADDEQIHAACKVAQLTETIEELEHGIDTLLGERGVNLSGGQKQRLAIARAVIREPKILILDDALSSVDTHTEEQILRRLKDVAVGRTSIIISHRISTIRHASIIIVIEDGRIVQKGTHDELVAAGGLYTRIHEQQLLEEELEEDNFDGPNRISS